MKKQAFCNFLLGGVSITEFGLSIPSPFTSLSLANSEVNTMTSWTLNCVVGGDDTRKVNIAAFEALLYSSAQSASGYENASGVPVSFMFGWLDSKGNVSEYISYQGFTLQFTVSTNGRYMQYEIKGYASLAIQSSMPVLRIPELCGVVQPSAIVEALAKGIKATSYYELDIDHNDAPTLVNHGAMNASFNSYVRGSYTGKDDYDNFPGLLKLSKSYSASRDAAGLGPGVKKLSQVLNNTTVTPVSSYLKKSITDLTPQCSSFSFWIDEPTMTSRGCIHYKSSAGLVGSQLGDTLQYGTADSNVISIQGSYNGVAYNMTDMKFSQLGFTVDGSGATIVQTGQVVNSWSSSLASVYQSANIVNDINAIASQFSGQFNIVIPGSLKTYTVAQPVSMLVLSGNTISPISGVYNIMSVSHDISGTFTTTLKLQRLIMSSANMVATNQGIFISGSGDYPSSSYVTTPNVISDHKVDFGVMYPTFEHMNTI